MTTETPTSAKTSTADARAGLPKRVTKARARTPRERLTSVLKHAVLTLTSLVMIYPLVWLVVSSLKPNDQIFRNLSIFTTDLTIENYVDGWDALQYQFGVFMMNSTIISMAAIVGNLLACSLAAYAFARLRFRFRNLLFAIMLMTIMLPFQVTLIPQFTIFKELGWLNTFLPLIVPKFLAVDAFFIFLMVQFIRALPKELFEAARIDGAGHFRTFVQVTLPLMVPALATTAIFTFIWTWSDFFGPLIYLRLPETFPVSVALKGFLDVQSSSNYGAMFAMSVVSLLPLIIVFLLGQRYLIKGFATTGMK